MKLEKPVQAVSANTRDEKKVESTKFRPAQGVMQGKFIAICLCPIGFERRF